MLLIASNELNNEKLTYVRLPRIPQIIFYSLIVSFHCMGKVARFSAMEPMEHCVDDVTEIIGM